MNRIIHACGCGTRGYVQDSGPFNWNRLSVGYGTICDHCHQPVAAYNLDALLRDRAHLEELKRENAEEREIVDDLDASSPHIPAGVVELVEKWENRYSYHRSQEESAAAHAAQDCANELAAAIEAKEGEGSMIEHLDDASKWVCDCGERCNPCSSAWRFTGTHWQHTHGDGAGHYTATKEES